MQEQLRVSIDRLRGDRRIDTFDEGQINIKNHDRLSELLNIGEDPFIVLFNATISGGLSGNVIFVSKSQILWICPED